MHYGDMHGVFLRNRQQIGIACYILKIRCERAEVENSSQSHTSPCEKELLDPSALVTSLVKKNGLVRERDEFDNKTQKMMNKIEVSGRL